jgi:hypothetical protein
MATTGTVEVPVQATFRDFDVQRLQLRPGDKVILRSRRAISDSEAQRIREMALQRFPDHEVIVLTEMDIAVISE